MSKEKLNVRLDESEIEMLDTIANKRGITASQLVRGIVDRALAELVEPVSLRMLFEARDEIDKRISDVEAAMIAEIKSRPAPDLVTATVDGVSFKVERADAIKAGFIFSG